ncbi:MAG: regulator of sigma protease [Gaiellaceae bacterium]|jgi:regulator of sigma E protease|nr:regulator of sigma protease [Gaiellaceae bacterium]
MNVLISILGLAVLILLHESGHFFVARAVGMKPRRFYLGFPPALVKVVRNGIEYGIGAIPLGGYVKIPGMHRPAASDLDMQLGPALKEEPSLFPKMARVQRALESSDFGAAREALPELAAAVEEANLSPAAGKAARRAVEELQDGLSDDAYWRQRTWKRIAVIFAGPGVNILVAIALVAIAFVIGVPGDADRTVKNVKSHTPAAQIGLQPGDTIVAVGGHPTPSFSAVSRYIRASKGAPIKITVLRVGKPVTLGPVRTKKIGDRWALGFEPGWKEIQYGPVGALGHSFQLTWDATKATVTFLPRLVTGSGRKEVSSPVGIVDYSSQAASLTFTLFLQILGLISLSLAILNLLPLLPLDGGHILFSIIEGLRGRAVGREVYERVSAIGIALFLVLMFIGLSNDINRLGGG